MASQRALPDEIAVSNSAGAADTDDDASDGSLSHQSTIWSRRRLMEKFQSQSTRTKRLELLAGLLLTIITGVVIPVALHFDNKKGEKEPPAASDTDQSSTIQEEPTQVPTSYQTPQPSLTPSIIPSTSPVMPSQQPSSSVWNQLGPGIYGDNVEDELGTSVALSSDGSIVAVGADGFVRVLAYDKETDDFSQLGQVIEGRGKSVSLSQDGKILAVGSGRGLVRVFSHNVTTNVWDQLGQSMEASDRGDDFGNSVSLSCDGRIVAIGAPESSDGPFGMDGYVQVFQLDPISTNWTQRGETFDGLDLDRAGFSVSLSCDGDAVAFGGHTSWSGKAQVYHYDSDLSRYDLLGKTIYGEESFDRFGYSVSLSSNGTILATGAIGHDDYAGHVSIHRYDSMTESFVQMGGSIDGETAGDRLGWSVSLSGDGTIVAIGSPFHDANGRTGSGIVRIFHFSHSTNDWVKVRQDIYGDGASDNFGQAVAVSRNGEVVTAGATGNDKQGESDNCGQVRLFARN